MHDKVRKRMQLTFYLMTFALKYEHISAAEGAPNGLSEGTPTLEIEIKGAPKVTIQLHLKMHMLVYLSDQKNPQNNSIKVELRRHSVLHLKFHFKKHEKLQKNVKNKIHLTLCS